MIEDAGFGDRFVHRVGHGIGTEAHEDPYLVAGNTSPLEAGHAFSVEPGIYFPGRFGMRLEDIVVATARRPPAPERRAARYRDRCVKLDAATFLLQWAAGGLLFGWVTTRRREVSLGYGWLIRIVFGVFAAGAAAVFLTGDRDPARVVAAGAALGCVLAATAALVVSVQRRSAGVRGPRSGARRAGAPGCRR